MTSKRSESRHGLVSVPGTDPLRAPAAADQRELVADLIARHGKGATGAMVADLLGKSESQGRRILAAHRSAAA